MAEVLEYAKRLPPWHRWLRRGVLAVVCVVLLGTLGTGWYWRRDISNHIAVWNWQRHSLSLSLPPSTVIVETDPARINALLAARDYKSSPVGAARIGQAEQPQMKALGIIHETSAEIFVHERISRGAGGGKRRLVVVTYTRVRFANTHGMDIDVLAEGSLWKFPHVVMDEATSLGGNLRDYPDANFHIFAGQADPADASHFTIEYEEWGHKDTMDGWLEADDTIKFKDRKLSLGPEPWNFMDR